MKLIIQVPCLNEEENLSSVLSELPTSIDGVSEIEVVVIDDGSTDRTAAIAADFGATVISHKHNRGLGASFTHGIEYALASGADVLVNTDGDNQYPGRFVSDLVQPVVLDEADCVIGNRRPWAVKHFSFVKRFFQWFGSFWVRCLTDSGVEDTVSGFRAYSREALLDLNVTSRFSYVLDTIMQLSKKNYRIVSIPIEVNEVSRPSRLFGNIFEHMSKSGANVLRLYSIYEPLKTFTYLSLLFLVPGLFLGARFMYFFFQGSGDGYIQSLIATAILLISAVLMFVLGVLGELLRTNRELVEKQLRIQKEVLYDK